MEYHFNEKKEASFKTGSYDRKQQKREQSGGALGEKLHQSRRNGINGSRVEPELLIQIGTAIIGHRTNLKFKG